MLYVILFYKNKKEKRDNAKLTSVYKDLLAPFSAIPNETCKSGLAYILRIKIREYFSSSKLKIWEPKINNSMLDNHDNLNLHGEIITLYWEQHKCYLLYGKEYLNHQHILIEYNNLLFPICPFDLKPLYPHQAIYNRKPICKHIYHVNCMKEMIKEATDGCILLTERQARNIKVNSSACIEEGCKDFSEEEIKIVFGDEIKIYENNREERKKFEEESFILNCCKKEILKPEFVERLNGRIFNFGFSNIFYHQ